VIRFIHLIIILVATGILGKAQQRPHFTHIAWNKFYHNPAYGGFDRTLVVNGIYRDQYAPIEGHIKQFYGGCNMPLDIWRAGAGAQISHQNTGAMQRNSFDLAYNKFFPFQAGLFSLGGRMGILHISIDGNVIRTPDGVYEGVFTHQDPLLNINTLNGLGWNWELGAYFKAENYEGGLAVYNADQSVIHIGEASYRKSAGLQTFFQYKYYPLKEILLTSSLYIQSDFKEIQSDICFTGEVLGNYFGGLLLRGYSSRSIDAAALIIGTNIGSHYKLSYSYDFGLSALSGVHLGTHEIMVRYSLNKILTIGLPPKIIYNPRHL